MLKFTIDLIIIYKIELIADKDQNNTYVFTNFRINLYQVIYAIICVINCVNHLIKIYSKICEYISIILVFVSNQFYFIYYYQINGEFQHEENKC